jgi:hypothetical protein
MSDKYQVIIQLSAEQGIKEAYYWVIDTPTAKARGILDSSSPLKLTNCLDSPEVVLSSSV